MRGKKRGINNHRGRQWIENPVNSCPIISLGDFNRAGGAIPTVGTAITGGALITGGSPAYNMDSITGSVPGLTFGVSEFSGDWYFFCSGTPTTFGSYSVTPVISDANGCPVTPRTYVFEVWIRFTNNTPQVVTSGDSFLISVSGIPATYGSGVRLERVELDSITTKLGALPTVNNPDIDVDVYLYNTPSTGNITDAYVYDVGTGNPVAFDSGSTPYSGDWDSGATSFSELDGFNTIGDWAVYGFTGTVNSISLLFRP